VRVCDKISSYTTEVKKSKFIAYIVPYSEFESQRELLKAQNPKASHIVYAFRRFNEFNQIDEGFSDDGEPKGCAGVPVLKVLRGEDIIDSTILIVRYFGGIKLGTGGMVRAYSLSAKNLIDNIELSPYKRYKEIQFTTSYSDIRQIEYHLKALSIDILDRVFGESSIEWRVKGQEESIARVKNILKNRLKS